MPIFLLLFANLLVAAPASAQEFIITANNVVLSSSNSTTTKANPIAKKLQQVYSIYGDVTLLPNTRMLYAKPRVVIKIVYPKIESIESDENIDKFNQTITNLTGNLVEDYKKQVADFKEAQAAMNKSELHNNLTIDFDTSIINSDEDPIISIRFSAQGYIAGMAHPYYFHRTLNYNLADGTLIELPDLFNTDTNYLEILSEYSRSELSKKLTDKQMLIEGTEAKLENFKNWNLKPYGLGITFDAAQVAPRTEGPQSVFIPYTALSGLLAKDTALADCLMHAKRCFRNRLLTGGFMDEAANTRAVDMRHRTLNPSTGKA